MLDAASTSIVQKVFNGIDGAGHFDSIDLRSGEFLRQARKPRVLRQDYESPLCPMTSQPVEPMKTVVSAKGALVFGSSTFAPQELMRPGAGRIA